MRLLPCSLLRSVRLRAVIPALTCLAYLAAGIVPCAPAPAVDLAAHASHLEHPHHGDSDSEAAPSIGAPCPCGCEEARGAGETGKRLGPVLLCGAPAVAVRTAQPPESAAPIGPGDLARPIDPPIPIAA